MTKVPSLILHPQPASVAYGTWCVLKGDLHDLKQLLFTVMVQLPGPLPLSYTGLNPSTATFTLRWIGVPEIHNEDGYYNITWCDSF